MQNNLPHFCSWESKELLGACKHSACKKKIPKQKAPSDSSTKTLTHNLGYMGYTSYIMIDLMSSINSQVQKKIEIKAKMF